MADNSLTPNLLESFDRLSLNQLSKSSPSRLPPFQLKRSRSQQGPVPPLPGNPNDHPPSSKQNNNSKPSNLSHVPCKFFKQGTCTAGANCIFSHNPDPTSESAVCKYYLKGNCKFGSKCALLHTMSAYAPDGRKLLRGPSAAAAAVARSPPVGSPLDFGPHMYSPARATAASTNTNTISTSASTTTTTTTHGFHHHQLSSSADARPYMMNGGNGMSPDSYQQQRSLFLHPSSTSMLSSSLSRLHSIPESSSGQYYGYGSLTAAAAAAPSSTPTGGFADYYDDNDLNDAMLPSSLNELLTPTELQMRRAREQHHLHSPSMRSPLDWPSQQQPTRLTNRSDYFTDDEPSAINIPGTSRHHHIRPNIGTGTGFFDETRSSSTNNNRLFDNDSFSPFMDDEGPFVMEDTGPIPPITTVTSNNSITARSSSSSSSQQQQPGDRRLTPFEFPSLISIPKSS
ncbi:hypothetical protein K492DRAFT_205127 [Lichtheimia hyalospora FSU 10163]|nr:hypothetical protein K492DRAFT_205127 [Lichtheimia hyalospora FSU 10163]